MLRCVYTCVCVGVCVCRDMCCGYVCVGVCKYVFLGGGAVIKLWRLKFSFFHILRILNFVLTWNFSLLFVIK